MKRRDRRWRPGFDVAAARAAATALVTVVAVLLGGSLLGVVGALVAIPVAAGVQLLVQEALHPVQDTR